MELEHIIPKGDGGSDAIQNAIPVCFECHAEIHAYNDRHPRGRKYRPDELQLHKEQWLELCKTSAAFLASVPLRTDVGPIQALTDELEFNLAIARVGPQIPKYGTSAAFATTQFERCMSQGILSLLEPELKNQLIEAYVAMRRANSQIETMLGAAGGDRLAIAVNSARDRVIDAMPLIQKALESLAHTLKAE